LSFGSQAPDGNPANWGIPWRCRRLVIGAGADGALPVLQQVREQARRRKIDLVVLPTAEAIGVLAQTTRGHQRHLAPDLLTLSAWYRKLPSAVAFFLRPVRLVAASGSGCRMCRPGRCRKLAGHGQGCAWPWSTC
jgi:hypothetical protein